MKVLWICNLPFPEAAEQLHIEASNKEGWISGMMHALFAGGATGELELHVAFPCPAECLDDTGICTGSVRIEGAEVTYYGFYEDTRHPEKYDPGLNDSLEKIFAMANADVVHCFGTEYPHAMAASMMVPNRERFLVGIQGLCTPIAKAYYADLPQKVIEARTFRDVVRKDHIKLQAEKFFRRGIYEEVALGMSHNITGRTPWDREYVLGLNPDADYYLLNENLRECFYHHQWSEKEAIPHRIFLSQGDYPLKGLHYMLTAMPGVLEKYPDATLVVAGNSLVSYKTWKDKLKISGYGKYLRSLIKKYHLQDKVTFTGKLPALEMVKNCLQSHVFVCCSTMENSSNSVGEAMLLGMPCVCADVGGLSGVISENEGILYEGHCPGKENLEGVSANLKDAILAMWEADSEAYGKRARERALKTHDREKNCKRLLEIYRDLCEKGGAV